MACLATSTDLRLWNKLGTVLTLGTLGTRDFACAISPWLVREDDLWHMFYVGSLACSSAPDLIPALPYFTLKAISTSLTGPWIKQPDVTPFLPLPNTYYSSTASPGAILKDENRYVQFFSAAIEIDGHIERTLGLARTSDLNGPWTLSDAPIVPLAEQIENASLYFDNVSRYFFLFTNHVGIDNSGYEFTDAIWVYWTKDPYHWSANDKAVVLDGRNCKWSTACIGMPSVVPVGERLAVLYDAPGGKLTAHMRRSIGIAYLPLPLWPPGV